MRRIGTGSRAAVRSEAAILAEQAPQAIREKLAKDVEEFCEAILHGIRTPTLRGDGGGELSNPAHRTSLQLYAQIMRAVGAETTLVVNLWQRLGAQDEAHASRLIERALEAEGMDERGAYEISLQFVADYRRRHGLAPLVEQTRNADAEVIG